MEKKIFIPGTNKIYPSIRDASKALGINAGNISSVISGRRKSAGGYKFADASTMNILIPETGRVYATLSDAAKSVGISESKAGKGLYGRSGAAIKGYHFVYTDQQSQSLQPLQQSGTTTVSAKKKSRKANKQAQINKRRQKKTAKAARQAQKAATRAADSQASTARRNEREAAKQERYRKKEIARRTEKLKSLMEKINDQLGKYDERQMLEYSSAVQEVMEYMQYLNEDDDLNLFDTSDANMEYLAENMSDFEIERWLEQLTNATQRNNGLFWDITKQEKERSFYAQEFGISIGEMDEYAEFLPELWLIFREGAKLFEYDAVIWDKIKQSVKGGIPKEEFRKAMDKLQYYFNYGGNEEVLKDLLSDLDAYAPEPEITDDLPF